MQKTTLGRTGLQVSVAGLGGGGPAQLGQRDSRLTGDESVALVRRALDLGVNFIDTAESYLTEEVIGRAVGEFGRDGIVLATKKSTWHGTWREPGPNITADELLAGLDASLRRLGADHVDVYQLHAVMASRYPHAVEELVPAMLKARDAGKIRFLGVTEEFIRDPGHEMLQLALADDCWDTMMVGYNLVNQSARERVLAPAGDRGVGTLIMFAVRRALSRPPMLRELAEQLVAEGYVDVRELDLSDPLGFLTAPGVADTLPEAAYRFCRHTPGVSVVLTGTGNVAHLERNLQSIQGPSLPGDVLARVRDLFAGVDHVSCN